MWPFRKRTQDRALWQVGEAYPGPSTYATASRWRGTDPPLRLAAVWACVRLIADTVSTLPVDVFREGSREPLPTPPLLVSPAAGWATHEWLYGTMVSLLLRGNAWGLITARTGPAMRPAQVELLAPDLVSVNVTLEGRVEYRFKGAEVDPADLWHVRAFTFPGSVTGLSPVEYARQAIGLGLATERFGAQFFEEGAHPTGVLLADHPIGDRARKEIKAEFRVEHRGRRDPLLVTGEGVRWQALSVAPNESQFLETQKFTVAQICRLYGVPPELVASETGDSLTYANIEDRDLTLWKYCLGPWLVRLESALGQLLPRGQFVKLRADALLRGTTKARYESYATAIDKGILTVDEVRALEDLPPLTTEGDDTT